MEGSSPPDWSSCRQLSVVLRTEPLVQHFNFQLTHTTLKNVVIKTF